MMSNRDEWELDEGPFRVEPQGGDESASWLWILRHRTKQERRNLIVTVTWKGFASPNAVPSALAREAFDTKGRIGVETFLTHSTLAQEVIYHSQTAGGPDLYSIPNRPVIRRLD